MTARRAAFLVALSLLVPATAGAAPPDSVELPGTARDFRGSDLPGGHADFESANGQETGIVAATLGPDGLPVYAKDGVPSATTHGKAPFDQWFRDTPGVNLPAPVSLTLARQGDGSYRFADLDFFPLDGAGWVADGTEPARNGGHNYSFTAELHSELLYTGTEVLQIGGDDDIWVFVNGRLVLDLGGVHGPLSGTVDLAARAAMLGLEPGRIYDVDLFFAERHTSLSTLQLTVPRLGFDAGTASVPATATAGDTVACAAAGWNAGVTLAYQWLRDGAPIAGATSAAYATTGADAGRTLTCRVTGSRRTSASADSGPLAVAAPQVVLPPPTPAPQPPATEPPPATDKPRRCAVPRRITVRVRPPKGARLRSAQVRFAGRKVEVRRKGRGFVARIDLRKRRPGTYWVRIRATTDGGRKFVEARSYRICAR